MKKTLMSTASLFLVACTQTSLPNGPVPHILPDLTSTEYSQLLAANPGVEVDGKLQTIVAVGKKTLDWVAKINSQRPRDKWIILSSKETQKAYPITGIRRYNAEIIADEYQSTLKKVDPKVQKILLQDSELPNNPPISDEAFSFQARKIEESYDVAVRWSFMEPALGALARRRVRDIRGYYFLARLPNLKIKLDNWQDLNKSDQLQMTGWLLNICYNDEVDDKACELSLKKAMKDKNLFSFYQSYVGTAKAIFDHYFNIEPFNKRSDVKHSRNSVTNLFQVPFLDPGADKVMHFVQDNIEQEWSGASWALKLDMQKSKGSEAMAHIEFIPGEVPHVDAVGGSTITMDANLSLDDFHNNWTIRHEFGHVLGFSDCYVEYYDTRLRVIEYYQINTEDLMCSRRGHILPTHFEQLMKVYGRY